MFLSRQRASSPLVALSSVTPAQADIMGDFLSHGRPVIDLRGRYEMAHRGIGTEWDLQAELTVDSNLSFMTKYANYAGSGTSLADFRTSRYCGYRRPTNIEGLRKSLQARPIPSYTGPMKRPCDRQIPWRR